MTSKQIMEKIGITPGPWDGRKVNSVFSVADTKCITSASVMLEDGLKNCYLMRKMYECRFEPDKIEIYYRRMQTKAYEKAAGMTWGELTEVVEE